MLSAFQLFRQNIIIIFCVFSFATQALASSEPPKKEAAAKASPDAPKKPPIPPPTESEFYIHEWLKFPDITGTDIFTQQPVRIAPTKERLLVAFLVASYEIGSQNMIRKMRKLQLKHQQQFTDFVYVFVNDLPKEARAFAKHNRIDGDIIMADEATKKKFQFPPLNLPMIYVADRHGWLTMQATSFKEEQLIKLDMFLRSSNNL
jgi:hypothetical protein